MSLLNIFLGLGIAYLVLILIIIATFFGIAVYFIFSWHHHMQLKQTEFQAKRAKMHGDYQKSVKAKQFKQDQFSANDFNRHDFD